jgi:DUF1365 family protein
MSENLDRLAIAQIGFGPIRHVRLKPHVHAFSYQGLFVRLPMTSGFASNGRWFGHNRAGLLSFHDRDHGDGRANASAWLRELLAAHGVTDVGGQVWLHTFPRMFGYAFKPVSFWYCERADGALRAIVAEVNNTFGERHCYLLENADGAPIRAGQTLHSRKVFHVSPFNPVQGRYEFRFLVRADRSLARVDYFDGQGCVLQTSIAGQHAPLSAANIARALLLTPWFTLGVIARIHWQALHLLRKRVPFFRKPEPPSELVSR